MRSSGHDETGTWAPDFDWITPSLAVGGAFPCELTRDIAAEHRLAAVVDLRGEACDDVRALAACGVAFLHLPTVDLEPPAAKALSAGVEFALPFVQRGARVLIHCQHGIGRSAVLAMCVLCKAGLTPLQALNLAKDRRWKVSPSPQQYEGCAAWLRAEGFEPPDFDTFGRIAYRHLASA